MKPARLTIYLFCLLGVVLLVGLVTWAGFAEVRTAMGRVGWLGFAWICLFQLAVLSVRAAGWWLLSFQMDYGACFAARWVRDGASNFANVVPAFGEVVGARVLTLFGMKGLTAGASTFLDFLAELVALGLYLMIGLVPLSHYMSQEDLISWIYVAAAVILPLPLTYGLTRRRGAPRPVKWIWTRLASALGYPPARILHKIATVFREIRGRRWAVCAAVIVHLGGWVVGALPIWAIAHQLGHPLSLGAALGIDSLVHAARTVFFVVPWGAGIQEGILVAVGAAAGLDATSALAVSLILRGRDLALSGSASLVWGLIEWRHAVARDRAARLGTSDADSPVRSTGHLQG